jgi:primosomal protein N'
MKALVIDTFKKTWGKPHRMGQGAFKHLGPADAPMYKLRGKFRRSLIGARRASRLIFKKPLNIGWRSLKSRPLCACKWIIDPQSFF